MNAGSSWRDDEIHAHVDGELDAEASARLEADSRTDTALAARIARQRELRSLLRAEFDPVLEEPIPQRLRAALAGSASAGAVTPIGAARKDAARVARPAWSFREWGAVAATLVVGILVGSLALRGPSGLPIEAERGRLVAANALDAALSSQLAGSAPEGAAVRIGMSFRAAGGEYCRTFTLRTGAGGLACRRAGRWAVELLDAAAQPAATDGFRQASSTLSPAMVGAIAALGAGEPLTAEEERQRRGAGWDAPGP